MGERCPLCLSAEQVQPLVSPDIVATASNRGATASDERGEASTPKHPGHASPQCSVQSRLPSTPQLRQPPTSGQRQATTNRHHSALRLTHVDDSSAYTKSSTLTPTHGTVKRSGPPPNRTAPASHVDVVTEASDGSAQESRVRRVLSHDSIATAMVELGFIDISEENDSDCVEIDSRTSDIRGLASTEDALLQCMSTTIELLVAGREADLFRSCAVFVRSAQGSRKEL